MKIGEFAKKHGVTHDTIRYYIEKGLLVPNKNEGQYKFSDVDSNELEKIIELKKMHFSLSDIHRILTFQRLGGASTEFSRNLFLMILEERQKHVRDELIKYNRINDYLTKQIEVIKNYNQKEEQVLGYPIASTELLVCPCCKKTLNLSAGVIEKNMIIQAQIDCECGYNAKIKDGIYIDERDLRQKLVNGKPFPTKEEFLIHTSNDYISYLFKGMAKMIDYILKYKKEPQYIIELSNCVGFFLLQYINYLPEDSIYILIDYDLERITQLKNNLERYYSHRKFIFFCCEYINLPMKSFSVDVVVDLFMSSIYEQSNYTNMMDKIASLLKENGIYTGSCWSSVRNSSEEKSVEIQKNKVVENEIINNTLLFPNINILESIEIMPDYIKSTNTRGKKEPEYQFVYVGKKP